MPDPYSGVVAWNDFETGTDGNSVSPGTSGGGNRTAFSGVQLGGTSTVTYTATDPIHDSLSGLFTPNAGFAFVRYDFAVLGTLSNPCTTFYFKLVSLPSAYSPICEGKDADAGAQTWRIGISSLGNFRLYSASNTTIMSTSTAPISTGVVYRMETQVNHSTGAYNIQLFAGDDAEPIDTLAGTAGAVFGTGTRQINFGRLTSPDYTFRLDSIAVDNAPIGPRYLPTHVWSYNVTQGT